MDSLARDVFLARQAGMSYGKWKATQPVTIKKPDEETDEKAFPCGFCGKMITDPHNRRRQYCDSSCAGSAAYRRKKERSKWAG